MSGININNREKSMIFYKDQMDEDMWETFCKQANRDPHKYEWLRVNFDESDVDESDDDINPPTLWEKLAETINYAGDYADYLESNPTEALETAANGGCLLDIDNMVHVKSLIGYPISYSLYRHIDKHADGGLMELEEEDIPALMWLIKDYALHGECKQDIWANYDWENHDGFWHKRVLEGLKKGE